jgi:hypothetical protein
MIDINDGINIANTAQYIEANSQNILNQHQTKLNQLPHTLQSEINTTINNTGGTHGLSRIEILSREQTAVHQVMHRKNSERYIHQTKANAFYGSDPLARTHQDLVEAYLQNPSSGAPQRWADSYSAAYAVQLATEEIRQLTERSHALTSQISQAQAEAQSLARQQAEVAARAAAEQRAAQARVEAEVKRQLEIARQAEHRRKQQVANELADRFDAQLKKLAHNQPQDIDEKLRWIREKYQELYAAHLKAAGAERKVGGFYNFPRNSKRWRALEKVQHYTEALVRTKHGIENVTLTPVGGAIASARPLVITPDGLIAGYEGAPFSVTGAAESLSKLRALAGGPVTAFFASVLYTPTLGNGELQRNPVVVTIPLSQFGEDEAYTPIRHKGKAQTDWLPYRVVASVHGDHTQLYFTPSGNSPFVQVRLVTLDPKTNLYTFTTEGLLPRTLTWTPNHAPGNDSLGSTELPVAQSDIKIYPGARVTQIEGRTDEHPMCDQADIDDYILEFPIESGIEPVYVMVSRSGPRYEPGTATGMGQPVGGNWLGSAGDAGGSPIPAQIADQLRGQDFRSFDKFRESFWKAIAADESLRRQFGKVDLEQMTNGAAPYAEPLDSVGGREKIEIHHKQRITDGGAVYDLENLSILTPKAHIDLHKKGTPQ